MTRRRDFLAQLAAGAAALSLDPSELRAAVPSGGEGPWDTSWIDRVTAAQYKVVFNVSEVADGAALDFAARFLDGFHEAHGTPETQTRPVVVFRHLGTILGLNDAMWYKYALADEQKIIDPVAHAPARRNIYWKADGPGPSGANRIEALQQRGMIVLVCNLALGKVAGRAAARTDRSVDEVRAEFRANLVPGATLVPNGVYGVVRAQNAGCAYMPGA
jgi:intracellular sulfur oxidation DsrE/DsrF family protein